MAQNIRCIVCNFSIFLLIISQNVALAQFNDSTFYHFNVASTGIINKTNIGASYLLNNSIKFSYSKKSIVVNTQNAWMYGKQQNIVSNNDFSSSADFNLYKTIKHFYYWGMANYDNSFSLKIRHRFQGGIGIGYNILNKKTATLLISNGILLERGSLFDKLDKDWRDYSVVRNSFKLKFRFTIKDKIIFDGSNYVQHSLEDLQDYIIRSNTNINVKILRWLTFTTTFNYNKISVTQRENILWSFGLGVDTYF